MNTASPSTKGFWTVLFAIGWIWLRSGWGKVSSDNFPESLGKTLTYFASKNPYGWYKSFLETVAIPNSVPMGYVVQWSEFLSGIAIPVLVLAIFFLPQKQKLWKTLLLFPLVGTLLMNVSFWLASAWTGPAADSLNMFMAMCEVVGIGVVMSELRAKKKEETI